MKHLFRASLALIIACAALFTLLKITYADEPLASSSAPTQDVYLYLPMIAGETNPGWRLFLLRMGIRLYEFPLAHRDISTAQSLMGQQVPDLCWI